MADRRGELERDPKDSSIVHSIRPKQAEGREEPIGINVCEPGARVSESTALQKPLTKKEFHQDRQTSPCLAKSSSEETGWIKDVFFHIARGDRFIAACHSKGKTQVGELTPRDFEEARSLYGIGVTTVEALERAYEDYRIKKEVVMRSDSLGNPVQKADASEEVKGRGGAFSQVASKDLGADALIQDVFLEVARGDRFIAACHSKGKTQVGELTPRDFEEARSLYGIGVTTVEALERAYEDYWIKKEAVMRSDSLGNPVQKADASEEVKGRGGALPHFASNAPRADTLIQDAFFSIARGDRFIAACHSKGKTLLAELTAEDFEEALELPGIGLTTVDALKKAYGEHCGRVHSVAEKEQDLTFALCSVDIQQIFENYPQGALLFEHFEKRGVYTAYDLKQYILEASLNKEEGTLSMERLRREYLAILQLPLDHQAILASKGLQEESSLTGLFGFAYPSKLDMENLLLDQDLSVKHLHGGELSSYTHDLFVWFLGFLFMPITTEFIKDLDKLASNTSKDCLLLRAERQTLALISEQMRVSKQRVSQLLCQATKKLLPLTESIAHILSCAHEGWFSLSEIEGIFPDQTIAAVFKMVLLESQAFQYVEFCEKFVRTTLCPKNLPATLGKLAWEVIGKGRVLQEVQVELKEKLGSYGLGFLDPSDVLRCLLASGYKLYGNRIRSSSLPYALACVDIIREFFPFDIKLDGAKDNPEMARLRSLMDKHYPGLELPEQNQALTARVALELVLTDRGRYAPVEKIVYDIPLFEEILQYVDQSEQVSFYYSEVYEHFKEKLLAKTSITNKNGLHGVIKHLYSSEFSIERDLFSKKGGNRQGLDERLTELLRVKGGPMTKEELGEQIVGVADSVFLCAVSRTPELIVWDTNVYNHMDHVFFDSQDKESLKRLLQKTLHTHEGYLSDFLLYEAVSQDYPLFLRKNKGLSPMGLFSIAAYFFGEDYRFRRPHIVTPDFPVEEVTSLPVIRVLLGKSSPMSHARYTQLVQSLGWSAATAYGVFYELEKDYARVHEDEYVPKDTFSLSKDFVEKTREALIQLLQPRGYLALWNVSSFEHFPQTIYPWNRFLLETVINLYNMGFRILKPEQLDRRYQRGIVVPLDSRACSYENLVWQVLERDGITGLTESAMTMYLKQKDLIEHVIPQELYRFSSLLFNDGEFTVEAKRNSPEL